MLSNFDINSLNLSKDQIITSNNFSKNADVIFSQFIANEKYEEIKKLNNTYLIDEYNGLSFYFLKNFEIKDGDILFCNTSTIDFLFLKLRNLKNIKNLILITSQSDISITKKIFDTKPECISKWYSINIAYNHKDLISIPLGLPETRNTKNIIYEDFQGLEHLDFKNKNDKIFSNFNLNTRYFHRYFFTKKAINYKDIVLSSPNLEYQKYLNSLNSYKYGLAPWGNGYDTHRLWEILYSGTIPILKKHLTFNNLNGLPIIFLNSISQLNNSMLQNFYQSEYNYNKLNVQWWITKIYAHKNVFSNKKIYIEFTQEEISEALTNYHIKLKKLNNLKKINTLIRKIHKKTFGKKVDDIIRLNN